MAVGTNLTLTHGSIPDLMIFMLWQGIRLAELSHVDPKRETIVDTSYLPEEYLTSSE
ncbi:hypothetical protein Ancab_021067 [Ancistrocladus abbreviatus]